MEVIAIFLVTSWAITGLISMVGSFYIIYDGQKEHHLNPFLFLLSLLAFALASFSFFMAYTFFLAGAT